MDDMTSKLDLVFQRFRAVNLRLHPVKCHWSVNKVKFLAHVFDERGISLDVSKLSIVRDFPRPRTPNRSKAFWGCAITTEDSLLNLARFRPQ